MKNINSAETAPRLCLAAETAADLMMTNPVSLRAAATVQEATAFLNGKGFSAAPVIDEAGRPSAPSETRISQMGQAGSGSRSHNPASSSNRREPAAMA